jgi:hypothetical protein
MTYSNLDITVRPFKRYESCVEADVNKQLINESECYSIYNF